MLIHVTLGLVRPAIFHMNEVKFGFEDFPIIPRYLRDE